MKYKFDILLFYYDDDYLYRMNNPANYSLPRLISHFREQGNNILALQLSGEKKFYYNNKEINFSLRELFFHILTNNFSLLLFQGRFSFRWFLLTKILNRAKIIFRTGGIFMGEHSIKQHKINFKQFLFYKNINGFVSTLDGTPVSIYCNKIGIPLNKRFFRINGVPKVIPSQIENHHGNYILVISRLSIEKRVELSIDIYKKFKELNADKNIPQLLIAGDGPLRSKIIDYINSNGLSGNVKLLGHINNCIDLINHSKAVLSIFSNNPILEAIACKKPVVALDLGEMKKIYQDYPNIYLSSSVVNGYKEDFSIMPKNKITEELALLLNNAVNEGFNLKSLPTYSWENRITEEIQYYETL